MDIFAFLKWVPAVKAYVSEIYSSDAYPNAGRTKNRLMPVVTTLIAIIIASGAWYFFEKVNLLEASSEAKLQQERLQTQLQEQTEKYTELRSEFEAMVLRAKAHETKSRELELKLEDKERELSTVLLENAKMNQDLSILANDNARMEAELRKRKLCTTTTPSTPKKKGVGADVYNELTEGAK